MGSFLLIKARNVYYKGMSQYLFLLGREPDLSLAELSSLFPSIRRQGMFALLETQKDISSSLVSLGGTIKV
jgi:organic radical activating enzyme